MTVVGRKYMQTSRLELLFEQRETWRVSRGDRVAAAECPFCHMASPMIAAETLARSMRISPREIYKRIECGSLHFTETPEMEVLVCLSSFSETNHGSSYGEAIGQAVEFPTSIRRV
jgi:hypothetical protein